MSPQTPSPPDAPTPIVKLWNLIIRDGINSGASEILFEPKLNDGVVRFQIDGKMREHMRIPHEAMRRLWLRTRVLADLCMIGHLVPQNGTARVRIQGKMYELDVAITPVPTGQLCVFRVIPLEDGA